MLPELILDNEEFEAIMEEARTQIAGLFPQWTDFNYHDPGITLIELFAWLKESRQFYLDQISDEMRGKYLKLLGIEPLHKTPSSALAMVRPAEDVTVLKGTKLMAGAVCFETEETVTLIGGGISECFSLCGGEISRAERPNETQGGACFTMLFGSAPRPGDCFYIRFPHRLPEGEHLRLYLELTNPYGALRNPVKGRMPAPLANLRLQSFSKGAWRDVSGAQDGTEGGVVSGFFSFTLSEAMENTTVCGKDGWYLRLYLARESYDFPPVLTKLAVNMLSLRQKETLVEEIFLDQELLAVSEGNAVCSMRSMAVMNGKNELYLAWGGGDYRLASSFEKSCNFDTGETVFTVPVSGAERPAGLLAVSFYEEYEGKHRLAQGTGLPFQEYDLEEPGVEYEDFSLIVREQDGIFRRWQKKPDFSCSCPEDRHYLLDAKRGRVIFGDCIRGMAPEGEIIVTSFSRTLGAGGNVKARAIDRFEGFLPEAVPVSNERDSKGGKAEESMEESFRRVRRVLSCPETAVTGDDFERLVMETPGLCLESCRVLPALEGSKGAGNGTDRGIRLVVKPYSPEGEMPAGISSCYRENILCHLEPYRMAGRSITLVSPQYVTVDLYADLVLLPQYVGAGELVGQAVKEYFRTLGGRFGAAVSYSGLYGVIDMLPCVARIQSLTLDVRGNGLIRNRDKTTLLPPEGIVRLGETKYLFTIGE